jgi:hypothetical protein
VASYVFQALFLTLSTSILLCSPYFLYVPPGAYSGVLSDDGDDYLLKQCSRGQS